MPSEEEITRRSFFSRLLKKGGTVIGGYLTFRFGFTGDRPEKREKKDPDRSETNISGEQNSIVLPVKNRRFDR